MNAGWLLSLVVGGAIGFWAAGWWGRRRAFPLATTYPADAAHVLELLRRANGASATCLVSPDAELPLLSVAEPRPAAPLIDRLVATARLALSDGREHVVQEGGGMIAVGDGALGARVAGWSRQPQCGASPADCRVRSCGASWPSCSFRWTGSGPARRPSGRGMGRSRWRRVAFDP